MAALLDTDTIRRDGLLILERTFSVPLDYTATADPAADGRTIEVFAREIVPAAAQHEDRPYLLWLQGGPGNAADRPGVPGGWLARALKEYRVILLDQRGTGKSTPLTHRTLPGGSVPEQSNYLTRFRADSIVRDAEAIRTLLIGNRKWNVLGQSFGGFCALSYLSMAPEGLNSVLITGGLADIGADPKDIYRANYRRTAQRNREFFATYPNDQQRIRAIRDHLVESKEFLPTGERLTPERFLSLGILLGTKSGFDQLHYLLESAFVPGREDPELTEAFLVDAGSVLSFAKNPLYAVMHEAIYSQGPATAWAAHTVRTELDAFAVNSRNPGDDVLLTGEMIYPWQFEQDPALTPLREVAEHLAQRTDWGPLYSEDVLSRNAVPAAAVVYFDDMFVPFEGSMKTASLVNGLRPIVTNDYQHDGIRRDGAALLGRLLAKLED